jgi:hypothetical protein
MGKRETKTALNCRYARAEDKQLCNTPMQRYKEVAKGRVHALCRKRHLICLLCTGQFSYAYSRELNSPKIKIYVKKN